MIETLNKYKNDLRLSEKKENTITQYEKYIKEYMSFADVKTVEDINKDNLIDFKEEMQKKYKTNTINIKITILNNFIDYLGLPKEYKLKHLKQQYKNTLEEVITASDYERLLRIAKARGKTTMYYLMQTLAETGVRISELKHITVEAVKKGYAGFDSKGTVERTAFINKRLKKELTSYCNEYNIKSGVIFKSKNNKPLDTAYIYKELQYIARTS